MTCIIGLEENGKAYIGADSAAASGWEVRSSLTPKIFQRGPFVIAYTTSFRMGQILHYQVELPEAANYDEEYMVNVFIEACRVKFKELGFTKIESNREEAGTFLVGVQGKVYQIYDDFQVQRFRDGLCAGGCGREYALGAMRAAQNVPPWERIKLALIVASEFCKGMESPYTVMEVSA